MWTRESAGGEGGAILWLGARNVHKGICASARRHSKRTHTMSSPHLLLLVLLLLVLLPAAQATMGWRWVCRADARGVLDGRSKKRGWETPVMVQMFSLRVLRYNVWSRSRNVVAEELIQQGSMKARKRTHSSSRLSDTRRNRTQLSNFLPKQPKICD